MLSGFTSQLGNLSGLIGHKSKESTTAGTGDNPDGGPDTVGLVTAAGTEQDSPSVGGTEIPPQTGRVLNSVRNHIPSWLGGSKPGGNKEESKEEVVVIPPPSTGDISPDKESDASSATGGADSDNQVSEGEAGEKGMEKGLEKVKHLGNFLFSTIKGAGQKIKDTNILSEFHREQESFLKSKGGKNEAIAPWIGHPKEEALKEEILGLSNDRRNFVRSPPSGVSFTWDWEEMAPVAKAILKEDPNLETMRYQLVPKVITEEHFWRNYFYRVSLLKDSMSDDEPKSRPVGIESDDEALERELNEELGSFEVVGGNPVSTIDEKEIDALLDLK